MKALSLTQPWATLVALGEKKIETRSWKTPWRGQLAIHAAKGFPRWARDLCDTEPFRSVLAANGITKLADLPLGQIVALADLVEVFSTNGELMVPTISEQERAFGDYSPERYGWRFERTRRLHEPVTIGGALGIWIVPWDQENAVLRQFESEAARVAFRG